MKVKALLVLVLVITFVFSCEVVTEPDLSVPQLVFEDEFDDYWPSLSSDGRYLAFLSDRDEVGPPFDEWKLCICDFEAKETTVLTGYDRMQYQAERMICWSKNAQWLYFVRDINHHTDGCDVQLCRVPFGGSEDDVEILKHWIYCLDVHSEGDKLAVFHSDYDAGTEYLAEYDIASGTVTPIESSRDIYVSALKYLPDGSGIMASIKIDDAPQYDSDVVIFPTDGSEPYALDYEFEHRDRPERISFSPDRNTVLLQIDRGIVTVPLEGGVGTNVLEYHSSYDGVWMHDGFVYFSAYADRHQDSIWRFKPEL